jgi:predicted dehydrogenase
MNIAFVGCGDLARKRLELLRGQRPIFFVDIDRRRAESLAAPLGAAASTDWRDAADYPEVDVVFVCTPRAYLAPITLGCVQAGKHVFVEQPGACRPSELTPIISAANDRGVSVRVGFPLRYQPAFLKALSLIQNGHIGTPVSVRGSLGRDGRPINPASWRFKPELAGGGELLEQGSQLIDLAHLLLGKFRRTVGWVYPLLGTSGLENHVSLHLETANGQVASLQASAIECRNLFTLEIVGETGKLELNGLGDSGSAQRLTWYRHTDLLGTPERVDWDYPGHDLSCQREMFEFFDDIRQHRQPSANLQDAFDTLTICETIYRNQSHEPPAHSVSTLASLRQTHPSPIRADR